MKKNILSIMGTRPEIIKVAPVIKAIEADKQLNSLVLSTSQHRDMSNQFFNEFDIKPDYDLDVMAPKQTLAYLTSEISSRLDKILNEVKPDMVLVQGDTTTAFVSGLIAFYHKIPVGYIEAGLRTFNKYFPFPEEMNRQMLSRFSSLNFAPTHRAVKNLQAELVPDNAIVYTGNTVVDALIYLTDNDENLRKLKEENFERKTILVTSHRRENLGQPMKNICEAILTIVERFEDCEIVFPVHPNPAVREIVYAILDNHPRIKLIEPVDYKVLVEYIIKSKIILTDSGGIQEESPTLQKPVLILRDETERPEVIEVGGAVLVGTDKEKIVNQVTELFTDKNKYSQMSNCINPFGDGLAAKRIVDSIHAYFELPPDNPAEPLDEFYNRTKQK